MVGGSTVRGSTVWTGIFFLSAQIDISYQPQGPVLHVIMELKWQGAFLLRATTTLHNLMSQSHLI